MSGASAKALRAQGDQVVKTDQPVDLASDTVTLMSARTQYKASIAVARAEDDNARSLLDLIG
jgi:hypothetical protein